MLFHEDIRHKRFNVGFITSAWAVSEIVQAAIDYIISVRMIKEGSSLDRLYKYKRNNPLSKEQIDEIRRSLQAFLKHLRKMGIEFATFRFGSGAVQNFALEYSIDTPDALHLTLASGVCHYFITNDEELCRKGIKEIDVLLPANFRTKGAVRVHNAATMQHNI